jgi:AcrR family transcriptional regulator
MSPRKYDMTRRASAVAQTRRRIIDATRALHTEQGIAATSWDDIAARARVGVGTVYRHFPSLDELIPACGEISMQIVALPGPQEVSSLFDGVDAPAERIERLVREAFAIYERGAPELRVIRNEPEMHPSVAEAGETVEALLTALVDAAVEPFRGHALRSRGHSRDGRPRHLAGASRPGPRARGGRRRREPDARGPGGPLRVTLASGACAQ